MEAAEWKLGKHPAEADGADDRDEQCGSDSAEDIAAGIKEIVTYYRSARPESKVLVLGIFPGSLNEDELRKKVADAVD